MNNIRNKINGFSLVELLVVISIIAVLTAIVVVNFVGARERARDAQRIQDMSSLKNALRMYYNENQVYPTGVAVTLGSGFSGYFPGVSGIGYSYYYTGSGDSFYLEIPLESGAGDEDIKSQQNCGVTDPTDKRYRVCSF